MSLPPARNRRTLSVAVCAGALLAAVAFGTIDVPPADAALAAAAPIAPATQGLSSPRPEPGEIPLGEWNGDGEYVFFNWDAEQAEGGASLEELAPDAVDDVMGELIDDERAKGRLLSRRYRTTLSITSEPLGRGEAVVMEIRSRRGKLADLGEETHLVLALERVGRRSRGAGLYRLIGLLYNPSPDAEISEDPDAAPAAASCITLGDTTVLTIRYMDNFTDTFRFERDEVVKTGMFHTRSGLIHWSERLRAR